MTALDPRDLRGDAEEVATQERDPEAAERALAAAREMSRLRREKRDLEEQLKEVRSRYDELRKDRLPELLHAAGLVTPDGRASLTLASGEKLHLQSDLHVSVRKLDEPAFFTWLREQGEGALIKETVHYQTLRAWARERLSHGADVPEQVTVHTYLKAVLRSG